MTGGVVCAVCYGARGDDVEMQHIDICRAEPIQGDDHHFDFGAVIGSAMMPLCGVCYVEDATILVTDDGRRWTDWRSPK